MVAATIDERDHNVVVEARLMGKPARMGGKATIVELAIDLIVTIGTGTYVGFRHTTAAVEDVSPLNDAARALLEAPAQTVTA